jgi:endonuclease YncB( thermonuclease family)
LSIDVRTLQRSAAFRAEYSKVPETGLSWAHYRELLTVSDPEERAFYERLAASEGFSRDRLTAAIDADFFSKKKSNKKAPQLKRPESLRYVFEAKLLRIIDGDTLLLELDLGFGLKKEHRVRLAHIDACTSTSDKGRAATKMVTDRLVTADRVLVQTKRADKHGRYIGNIFYSTRKLSFEATIEKGRFLNQELLDERLAIRVK